ncbi:MAG: thioredoxin family protein, partial [Pseudomonadota bacterium]
KPEEVKKRAIHKKGIIVLVSTEWCPPCNVVKEFLIPSKTFKEATKDFFLVYVDGDSSEMDQWRPILRSYYYPSFVMLNHNMQRVDIITSYQYGYKLRDWIQTSQKHLNDTIDSLEKRLLEREKKGLWSQIKSLFTSEESLIEDEKRWMNYLRATNQTEEKESFFKRDPKREKRHPIEALATKLMNVWIGKKSGLLSSDERAKKRSEYIQKIFLTAKPEDYEKIPYVAWLATEHCPKPNPEKKEKNPYFTQEECQKILNEVMAFIEREFDKMKSQLTPTESIYFESELATTKGQIYASLGKTEMSQQAYQTCNEKLNALYKESPLGQKSRAVRIQQVYCLKENDSNQNLAVLQSLAKDYPYDATFYGKLADYYLDKKEYSKALDNVKLAVKYSYGDMWAKNTNKKAKILSAMGHDKKALKALEEAFSEINLTKDHKKQWWLNAMRGQYEALKKKLK